MEEPCRILTRLSFDFIRYLFNEKQESLQSVTALGNQLDHFHMTTTKTLSDIQSVTALSSSQDPSRSH